MKLDDVIREFVESYESRDPDYTPTDHERALIEGAINGFLDQWLSYLRDVRTMVDEIGLLMAGDAETERRFHQPEQGTE